MSSLSILARLLLLSFLVNLSSAASNVTISSVSGCNGRSGFSNATGCAPGVQLSIAGTNFHTLNFHSGAAVAVGSSTYWTCDSVVVVSSQQLTCTLPYVQMAGSAFLPVFIFNQSNGFEYTSRSVGLQYAGVPLQLTIVSGCGWTSPYGVVYGCNGNAASSNLTLQINRIDALPSDWELAVGKSANSVKGSTCSTVGPLTVKCTLPPSMPEFLKDSIVSIWLQTSNKTALTHRVSGVVYATAPTITDVTGCCVSDSQNGYTTGCTTSSPVFTVTGSGFARAWDGGAPTESPIHVASGSGYAWGCDVASYDEWTMVCASLSPAMQYDFSQEYLGLSVSAGNLTSNSWGVQIYLNTSMRIIPACPERDSSSSTASASLAPQITWIGGSSCQGGSDGGGGLLSCSTSGQTVLTIVGSGFLGPQYGDSLVQLVSQCSLMVYSCGASSTSDTSVTCMNILPSLSSYDSGCTFLLTVTTGYGASNSWALQLTGSGYVPSTPSASSSKIAGMNPLAFIIVISIASLVVLSLLVLAVLSCCCGVSLAALACCRAASDSPVSAPLLIEPPPAAAYAVPSSSSYPSSSRFGLSLPPNPLNYPAVHPRNGGY